MGTYYPGQNLEVMPRNQANWTGTENFDTCFCVILGTSISVLFLKGRLGARLYLHPFLKFFQDFLIS